MDRCEAIKKSDGTQCSANATILCIRNYCGTHHNAKMRTDNAYRIAYNQFIENAERRRQTEVARREQEEQARIAANRERNNRYVENAPDSSTSRILKYGNRLVALWDEESIPDYDCVKAYVAIVYKSPRHAGFVNLIRAVVTILNLKTHHMYPNFRAVPIPERTAAYTALHTALEPYGEIDYMHALPTNDRNLNMIVRRQQREEAARRAAAAAALAAQRHEEEVRRAAQQRAEFEQADRERPVVFQRDPEGGIDLRAFAADAQSVHRSSVQNATQRILTQLMTRPVSDDQESVYEINVDFNNPILVGWRSEAYKLTTIDMFTDEYFSMEAFSVKYGDVVDRVWAFIRGHAERTELTVRLAQEVSEGTGMCANGKMARLVNVLQGYDETLDVEPPREVFQSAIALLMKRPMAEREARARELFIEYRIPTEEHNVWLEPLLDAEE
jgi:hypothetical protein